SIEEAMATVPDLTWGDMCDAVILTVGVMTGDLVQPALDLTAKGGTVVMTSVANMMEGEVTLNSFTFAMLNKELKGSLFGSGNPRYDIPELLSMYREGDIKLDELVTKRYTLDQVNEGYEAMRAGENLRGIIEF
ncbi:MAG TPA: zinc-binding dehydrogenase, partial [Microthrixaceae bacterium]|nr:zinc-binding dehydrogenase [Microthrixaceae bacterium]